LIPPVPPPQTRAPPAFAPGSSTVAPSSPASPAPTAPAASVATVTPTEPADDNPNSVFAIPCGRDFSLKTELDNSSPHLLHLKSTNVDISSKHQRHIDAIKGADLPIAIEFSDQVVNIGLLIILTNSF
jgi:hypothetical protein